MKNTELEILINEIILRSLKEKKKKNPLRNKYAIYFILISLGWYLLPSMERGAFFILSAIGLSILSLIFIVMMGLFLYVFLNFKKQMNNKDFIFKLSSNVLGASLDKEKVYVSNISLLGRTNFLSLENTVLNKEEELKFVTLLKKYFDTKKVEDILMTFTGNGKIRLSNLAHVNFRFQEVFEKEPKEEERKLKEQELKDKEQEKINHIEGLMKETE